MISDILKHYKMLLVSVSILMLIIIARDILQIAIPDLVIVGFFSLCLMLMPFKDALSYVFFVLPFTCGIPGYTMTAAFLVLLYKGPKFTIRKYLPLIIILFIETINYLLWGAEVSIMRYFSFSSFTAIFFYLIILSENKSIIKHCLLMYLIGSLFVFSVIVFNLVYQFGLISVLSGSFRNGALGSVDNSFEDSVGHIALNANSLAYFSIVCVSIMLCTKRIIINNIFFYYLFLFLFILGGIVSFSRTYFVLFFLLFSSYFIIQNTKNKIRYSFVFLLFAIIIINVFPNLFDSVLIGFNERFENSDLKTAGGRTFVFIDYFKAWTSNVMYILFGCGASDYTKVLGFSSSAHNGTQQVLVCCGLVGFLTYVITIFSCVKMNLKRIGIRKKLLFLLPLIFALLFVQSIQFLNPYYLMLPFIPALYVTCLKTND